MTLITTDHLTKLVRQKHACLTQLAELGRQQRAVAESGDVNDLLRILGQKQLLIVSMQTIEAELAPFREDDPERRAWRCPADRAACAKLVAECELLFRSVLEHERHAEDRLRRRRDDAELRLCESRAADAIRGAYVPHAEMARGSLDLTSEV